MKSNENSIWVFWYAEIEFFQWKMVHLVCEPTGTARELIRLSCDNQIWHGLLEVNWRLSTYNLGLFHTPKKSNEFQQFFITFTGFQTNVLFFFNISRLFYSFSSENNIIQQSNWPNSESHTLSFYEAINMNGLLQTQKKINLNGCKTIIIWNMAREIVNYYTTMYAVCNNENAQCAVESIVRAFRCIWKREINNNCEIGPFVILQKKNILMKKRNLKMKYIRWSDGGKII